MSDDDPRFKPIKTDEQGIALVPDRWKVDFFASAGELSRFYTELKDNARLMGTRCPSCGSVYCLPRSWCHDCYEDCEWVEMKGTGVVTLFSQVHISLSDMQTEVPYIQGGVLLDGARYALVNFIRNVEYEKLYQGMPVRVEFKPAEERTGRMRDFYFAPVD